MNARRLSLVLRDGKHVTTTSRIVADHFGKTHKSVLRAIENLRESLGESRFNRLSFAPIDYTDSKGRTQQEWVMDHAAFAVLAMGFTGAKAACLRQDFVEAFKRATKRVQTMERQQPEWKTARKQVADAQSLMSMVLTVTRERSGKATEGWHYANEAGLLTYALTGKAKPVIDRQMMSAQELEVLAAVERLNSRLLVLDKPYGERKEKCRALAFAEMTKRASLLEGAAA